MSTWILLAENGTENGPSTTELLGDLGSFFQQRGLAFALDLLAAAAILLIGRWAAMLIRRFVRRVGERAKLDETLIRFGSNVLYTLLLAFVVLAALEQLGVDTTSFAAVLAAAGFAIGLALQGSLSNFAAGVMLILFKPFRVGDYVEAGGTAGVVEEILIFHTRLRTGDNVGIVVPNSSITGGNITNYSAKETRRIDLVVGCGYGDDLRAVRNFLEELLGAEERILPEPEPVIAVSELADSSVNFVVRPWVNSADYWAVRWDLTEKIKLGFDERNFSIPYPSRDVYMHQSA